MPTEAKRETVAELREELAGSRTLIVSEYRGLTVKEIAEIRRALRKQDVTLSRRQEPPDADRRRRTRSARRSTRSSIGPTAIAFGNGRGGDGEGRHRRHAAVHRIVRITGGVLGDRAIDADGVTRLATLPSRDVLLAKLAGGMQAPIGDARRPVRRPPAQPGLCACAGRRAEGRGRRPDASHRDPTTTRPTPTPTRRPTPWQP